MSATLGTGVNVRDFRDVAKALKKAQPALYKEVAKGIRSAGKLVQDDAKVIAGQYSTSIPKTIKVRQRGLGVSVEAGGVTGGRKLAREIQSSGYGTKASNKALKKMESLSGGLPIAGLYELGNKGGRNTVDMNGTFRHPVYGHVDRWVDQERHSYLLPAGEKNKAASLALVESALGKVTKLIATAK